MTCSGIGSALYYVPGAETGGVGRRTPAERDAGDSQSGRFAREKQRASAHPPEQGGGAKGELRSLRKTTPLAPARTHTPARTHAGMSTRSSASGHSAAPTGAAHDRPAGNESREGSLAGSDAAADEANGPGAMGDVTRCVCGYQDVQGGDDTDDNGLYVQCDSCSVWQHGHCVGFRSEDDVPEQYFCELCRPDLHTIRGRG